MNKSFLNFDSLLGYVGMARRRRALVDTLLPAAGLVALGAVFGAGLGLMLAPSSGSRLRQDVGDRLDRIKNRVTGRPGILNATPHNS